MSKYKSEIFNDLFGGRFRYYGDIKPTEDEIEVERNLSQKKWTLIKIFQNSSDEETVFFFSCINDIFEEEKTIVHKNKENGIALLIYEDSLTDLQKNKVNNFKNQIINN